MPTYSSSSCARCAIAASSARNPGVRKTAPTRPGVRPHVAADHDVLERGHVGEQADVLERARDAGLGDLVHRRRLVGLAAELEGSGVGRVESGENVEEGRLAGAVRTDQAVDLARLDRDADVRQRLQSAEALRDRRHPEDRRAHRRNVTRSERCASPAAGSGVRARCARSPRSPAARRRRRPAVVPPEPLPCRGACRARATARGRADATA